VPRVTVTIITLNEAEHIAAAIDSASWADEVILVDSGSTDETVSIARGKAVRIETRPWTGYVDQKNFAAGLASNDWILSLDADERITPARRTTRAPGTPARGVSQELRPASRLPRRYRGAHTLDRERVRRVPEVRKTLGTPTNSQLPTRFT